jgi:hypothetical protein
MKWWMGYSARLPRDLYIPPFTSNAEMCDTMTATQHEVYRQTTRFMKAAGVLRLFQSCEMIEHLNNRLEIEQYNRNRTIHVPPGT